MHVCNCRQNLTEGNIRNFLADHPDLPPCRRDWKNVSFLISGEKQKCAELHCNPEGRKIVGEYFPQAPSQPA